MRNAKVSALRWALLGAWTLGVLGGEAASAATFRWKHRQGEQLRYEMVRKTTSTRRRPVPQAQPPEKDQKDQPKEQEFQTTVTQTINLTWTVKQVNPDGTARMTQTIDRIRTKSESPTELARFEYDSQSGKEPTGPVGGPMGTLLRALVGAEFSFTMAVNGELSDVKVPANVVKILREMGPVAQGSANPFSEEGLKETIVQSSLALPKDDVPEGYTWSRQTRFPAPPLGTMVYDKTFRFVGKTDAAGVDRITLTTKISLAGTPDESFKAEITGQDSGGEFLFDQRAGRITSSKVSQRLDIRVSTMGLAAVQTDQDTSTMKLISASE